MLKKKEKEKQIWTNIVNTAVYIKGISSYHIAIKYHTYATMDWFFDQTL